MQEIRSTAAAMAERMSDGLRRLWWLLLTRGIAAVAFGLAALFWPEKSLTVLVFLVGAYFMLDGLSSLLVDLWSGHVDASLLPSLASAIGGTAVLFWPGMTTHLLLVILGIWAVVQGVAMFLAGRGMRAEGEDGSLIKTAGAILTGVGIAALIWRDVGAVAMSWSIALVALVVGGLLIFVASRIKNARASLRETVGNRS